MPTVPPLPPEPALRRLLPPDVVLTGSGAGLRHPAARPVWFGVVWSRMGRADLAWAQWDRVKLPALQPWIEAERGRVLRELGLHAQAEAREWPAVLAAEDPVDRLMLRISLAADAVGLGDLVRARRRLAAAESDLVDLSGRDDVEVPRVARQRLRLAWVRLEVALVGGDELPHTDLPCWDEHAGAARQPAAAAHGSDFHAAKGLLFGGLAHAEPRLLDAAATLAPAGLAWAVHLARADLAGVADAEAAARSAWRQLVPPPQFRAAVAETAVAQRLGPPAVRGWRRAGTSTGCATGSC